MEWHKARVKWYNSSKGYGFVNIRATSRDVFLHASILEKCSYSKTLDTGSILMVQYEEKPKGLTVAAVQLWTPPAKAEQGAEYVSSMS
jgi:CspA family cold shock protein